MNGCPVVAPAADSGASPAFPPGCAGQNRSKQLFKRNVAVLSQLGPLKLKPGLLGPGTTAPDASEVTTCAGSPEGGAVATPFQLVANVCHHTW